MGQLPLNESEKKTATRADLLNAVYESCKGLSRAQARDIFEMTLEEISTALVRGETVKLRSFGLFSVRAKRERIGRNPRTGIEVPIKPRRVLTFRPSPVLVALINGEARILPRNCRISGSPAETRPRYALNVTNL